MNIAIIGVGTVGEAVAKILEKNGDLIEARCGERIVPVVGVVRSLEKKRDVNLPLTDDLESVLRRDDIDVFVELMGGVEEPYRIVSSLLSQKKPVVTANKALLAYHRMELESIAGDTPFGYEASVAGGIPIIKALREGLSANHIQKITGIMNGTSNFILSKMSAGGASFEAVLREAQEKGYAEADPTFDVEGLDTAHKLLILASIAYSVHAKPEEILVEGITKITAEDIKFASEFDFSIKLLGIAKRVANGGLELRVHPTLLPKSRLLSSVDGVMNAVSVVGDAVGESLFYGAGAGGNATASAVISDLMDMVKETENPMLGYAFDFQTSPLVLKKPGEVETKYYIRLRVLNRVGVLAAITKILSEHNISIESFLQKNGAKGGVGAGGVAGGVVASEESVTLFFTTQICKEADLQKAASLLKAENIVLDEPFVMRIEE